MISVLSARRTATANRPVSPRVDRHRGTSRVCKRDKWFRGWAVFVARKQGNARRRAVLGFTTRWCQVLGFTTRRRAVLGESTKKCSPSSVCTSSNRNAVYERSAVERLRWISGLYAHRSKGLFIELTHRVTTKRTIGQFDARPHRLRDRTRRRQRFTYKYAFKIHVNCKRSSATPCT